MWDHKISIHLPYASFLLYSFLTIFLFGSDVSEFDLCLCFWTDEDLLDDGLPKLWWLLWLSSIDSFMAKRSDDISTFSYSFTLCTSIIKTKSKKQIVNAGCDGMYFYVYGDDPSSSRVAAERERAEQTHREREREQHNNRAAESQRETQSSAALLLSTTTIIIEVLIIIMT